MGTRYALDRVALLDAIAIRRGVKRAQVIAGMLDEAIEREFPGALRVDIVAKLAELPQPQAACRT